MNTSLFNETFDLTQLPYATINENSHWIRKIDRDIMICLMNGYTSPCFSLRWGEKDGSVHTTIYTQSFQFCYRQIRFYSSGLTPLVTQGAQYETVGLTTIQIPQHFLFFLKLSTPGISDFQNGIQKDYRGTDLRKAKDETHPEWFVSSSENEAKQQIKDTEKLADDTRKELSETQETLARTLREMDELRSYYRHLEMENNVLLTQVATRDHAIQRMEWQVKELELENRKIAIDREGIEIQNRMLRLDKKVMEDSLNWFKETPRR